jgi:multicomponent Na+:H+ antiporter subunit C
MEDILGLYNFWVAIFIMMIGFYGVIAKRNFIKQAIALGLFQTGVFLFYITMAVFRAPDGTSGRAPIWSALENGLTKHPGPYDNPLPHVLILTAIVVSVSTLAVALGFIINIKKRDGTIEENEVREMDAGVEEGKE